MSDEKLRQGSPVGSTEHLKRFLLVDRLAKVMKKMIDAKVADPDTETHEIITHVAKDPEAEGPTTPLDPKNLGHVLDAVRRHGPRRQP